jgi:hypothetical protein
MAVKLLPFQPSTDTDSASPNTSLSLLAASWINYQMPSKDAQVKAMFEIGKAEIAGAVTRSLFWRVGESKEEFWEIWGKRTKTPSRTFISCVSLIGLPPKSRCVR